MFRSSYSAVNRPEQEPSKGFWANIARSGFLLFYFTLLPILATVIVNWAVYFFTQNNFFPEAWMAPTLIIISTFLAGALIRQKMEDEMGGMGLFTLAILSLILFAWLTYQDVHTIGGIYSRFMPRFLTEDLSDFIYALPAVGILGMLVYKHFTIKHYS